MKGGTYARALQAGFTDKQASFFTQFSIDLKNETSNRLEEVLENFIGTKSIRNYIAIALIKAGHKLAKKV